MDPTPFLTSAAAVARERGISEEELERKFAEHHAAAWERERERTPDCLGYAEWDAFYEGTLSSDRLEHAVHCKYCNRLLKAVEADPVKAAAFAEEAAGAGN